MKKAPLVIVIVVALGLLGWFVFGGKKTQAPKATSTTSATTTNTSQQKTDTTSTNAVPTNAVNISDMKFTPAAVSIPAGTTMHWNNNDSVAHTVTADDGSFDSASIAPGSSYTHTFDKAGTYKYHCTFHSSMTGTVVVR